MEILADSRPESGDSGVTLTHASLNLPEAGAYCPGDEIDFQIRLLFKTRAVHPTFSLLLHRVSDNLCIYDVAAQERGLQHRVYEPGEEIHLRFRARAHLLRGIYSLGFNVFLPSEHTFLLRAPVLRQFPVHEDASYQGIVDIECASSEVIRSAEDLVGANHPEESAVRGSE
jgi:hypothetical protein